MQLITWNQNGHIKESNLVMKCSLRRILGKCSWSLLESVFNWQFLLHINLYSFKKLLEKQFPCICLPLLVKKKKRKQQIESNGLCIINMLCLELCITQNPKTKVSLMFITEYYTESWKQNVLQIYSTQNIFIYSEH